MKEETEFISAKELIDWIINKEIEEIENLPVFTMFQQQESEMLMRRYMAIKEKIKELSLPISPLKAGETEWISVNDRLPEEGQIVDVWQMVDTQMQNNIRGMENSRLHHKSDFTGWRSTNYRYSSKQEKTGEKYSSFQKVKETTFNPTEYPNYKELIVENGEVTHWREIPESPSLVSPIHENNLEDIIINIDVDHIPAKQVTKKMIQDFELQNNVDDNIGFLKELTDEGLKYSLEKADDSHCNTFVAGALYGYKLYASHLKK